jgi:hypothetical protein
MATFSTQQILDFVLEQISKDFNLDILVLKNKYSSIDDVSNAIKLANTPKKRVVRKLTKSVPTTIEAPITAEEAPIITEAAPITTEEEAPITNEAAPPKKKVIRKVVKAVDTPSIPVEQPIVEQPINVTNVTKKKVIRKTIKPVEEPVVVTEEPVIEEKVKPKRIIKKVPKEPEVTKEAEEVVEPKKKSKKNVELVEFNTDSNSMEGLDEIEKTVYTDAHLYNDEDSDSLEPREINGVKYYIDTSNYLYDMETQDLVGKFNENTNNVVFLSDFPTNSN